jgi:protein-ribulosamine 3-kinase
MLPTDITDSLSLFFASRDPAPFRVLSSEPLSGGSINQVYRLTTSHGVYCLKYNNAAAFPEMFESEARGLRLLASAGEVRVPQPLLADTPGRYSFLLLEYIAPGPAAKDLMERFGISLARLHRHSAELFGLDHSNYMGSLAQHNTPHGTWADFFAQERLEPQVRLAMNAGLLPADLLSHFESLYRNLDEIFPNEPPALVHGDLWGGNYLVTEQGQAALIDPAVCYSHREVDIAMSTLFGGFSSGFYESYLDEYPLAVGWRTRLDLCNLYPLLVHLNLFGRGYLSQVVTIIRRY